MENLIEVRGLCKRYKNFSLEGVDLTLPAGQILGLVGENGAGKTTTLKAILNVIRPDEGEIRVLGRPPGTLPAAARWVWCGRTATSMVPSPPKPSPR